MLVQNYTCHGHEWVKASERVYKKWTLHDNNIIPKQLEKFSKESILKDIGIIGHENYIQRKQCGGRWDIRRNVRCKPKVHVSTTTLMRVNTSVNTK